jgi:hypothetical protein
MNDHTAGKDSQPEHQTSNWLNNDAIPTPREMEIVLAIVNRPRLELWDTTARKLNISRRTLFEYRQNPRIQHAVQMIVINHLRIDAADVLAEVVRKAKQGNLAAAKLFLDQTNIVADFDRTREREHATGISAFIGAFREMFPKLSPNQREQFIEIMRKREIDMPKELHEVLTHVDNGETTAASSVSTAQKPSDDKEKAA